LYQIVILQKTEEYMNIYGHILYIIIYIYIYLYIFIYILIQKHFLLRLKEIYTLQAITRFIIEFVYIRIYSAT